ncbi:MAG TPA: hypothetical protein VF139_02615 [Candidatus Polarisedimenticolaceae bacterium]
MNLKSGLVIAGSAIAFLGAAHAAPTPIDKPTTIDLPGTYVVVVPIDAAGGVALTIRADSVTVNLDGFVVRGDVVLLPARTGTQRIVLEQGRIEGKLERAFDPNRPPLDPRPTALRLSEVSGFAGGIRLDACREFVVRGSRVDGSVVINPNASTAYADVADSAFTRNVDLGSLDGSVVRGSAFLGNLTLRRGSGLTNRANLVERNSFWRWSGIVHLPCTNCLTTIGDTVADNVAAFIHVSSGGNAVRRNSIRNGTIAVSGSRNTIEGNAVQGPGFGLVFDGDANTYRENVLRNNELGAVQDNGTGNLDAGGNVR